MNNIIFQTIRACVVLGVALFAFISNALAAPVLTPVSISNLSGNTATLIGHVSNPYKNSTVWIEWSVGSSVSDTPSTGALQGIYGGGAFELNLNGLSLGETYSYRAAAMEDGLVVYSSVSSFTTPNPIITPAPAVVPTSIVTPTPVKIVKSVPVVKSAQVVAPTSIALPAPAVAPVATEGFTNGSANAASVISAESGVLPSTLLGWVALLVSIFVALLMVLMIIESSEKRKNALEIENSKNLFEHAVGGKEIK